MTRWLQVSAFVMSTGTGGTIAGTGMYLKIKNPDVRVVLADPPGSALYNFVKTGRLERTGSSITEGIGNGRVTENLRGAPIDDAVFVEDSRTIRMLFRLLCEEGLFVGASSALNVVAAMVESYRFCLRDCCYHCHHFSFSCVSDSSTTDQAQDVAKSLGTAPNRVVVTVLCDGAARYLLRHPTPRRLCASLTPAQVRFQALQQEVAGRERTLAVPRTRAPKIAELRLCTYVQADICKYSSFIYRRKKHGRGSCTGRARARATCWQGSERARPFCSRSWGKRCSRAQRLQRRRPRRSRRRTAACP